MARPSEFKRIKHRQMPGDICKAEKIYLREKKDWPSRGVNSRKRAKSFCKMIFEKTRAVLKRRGRREVQAEVADFRPSDPHEEQYEVVGLSHDDR